MSLGSIGDITFMLNPADDLISIKPLYHSESTIGREVPRDEYEGYEGEQYSLELLFDDNYLSKAGGTEQVIQKLRDYSKANSNTGSPPAISYNYGPAINCFVTIRGLEIVAQKRNGDNQITRATIKLELKEFIPEELSHTPIELRGVQIVLVTGKETFRSLAYKFLGSADLWKPIYNENADLVLSMDGLVIPGGSYVLIPEWDVVRESIDASEFSVRELFE